MTREEFLESFGNPGIALISPVSGETVLNHIGRQIDKGRLPELRIGELCAGEDLEIISQFLQEIDKYRGASLCQELMPVSPVCPVEQGVDPEAARISAAVVVFKDQGVLTELLDMRGNLFVHHIKTPRLNGTPDDVDWLTTLFDPEP